MATYRKILLIPILLMLVLVLQSCTTGAGNRALTAEDLFVRHMEQSLGSKHSAWPTSITMRGKLIIQDFGLEAPITIRQKAPDGYLFSADLMGTKIGNACYQGSCWAREFGQSAQPLSGEYLTFQLQMADFNQFLHVQKYYAQLELFEPEDGADTLYAVKARRANGSEDIYYFSKETGLMQGSNINAVTAQGIVQANTTNENFKQYGKIKVPSVMTQSSAQANVRIEIESVDTDPIDDAVFAMPE